MTERLKAWCHWKHKENHVSEDTLLMVRDIEALLEENTKLRKIIHNAMEDLTAPMAEDETCGVGRAVSQLQSALEAVE